MLGRTRTIKVSEEELNLLERAKQVLEREGYGKLSGDLNEALQNPEVKASSDDLGKLLAGLALGAIAAVGAAAIINMLTGKDDEDED